jgi:hypothetical protein
METFNFAKTQSVSVNQTADGNIELAIKGTINCLGPITLVVSQRQAREIAEAIVAIA